MIERSHKLLAVGFSIGILSGLLGIGGGVFLVPIMVGSFAVAQHNAHATSLAVVVPTAIVTSFIYGFNGSIDFGITLNVVIGSMVGAAIGARVAQKISAAQLKKLFGVLLLAIGLRMIIG